MRWFNWLLAAIMAFALVMQAQALCGDGVCDGRTNWQDPDSGLGVENWDNCPGDCARVFNQRPTWVTYHSNEEIDQLMSDLVKDHAVLRERVVGSSVEGRPIKIYVLGNGSRGFFFIGRLHGVEDCGTEAGLQFLRWVLMSSKAEAADLRANGSIIFLPVANPDSSGRQNAHNVDLNRNFPTGWGLSGSTDPFDPYDYIGPSPGSEPETQAIMKVLDDYDPKVFFDVHCGMALASGGGNTSLSLQMMQVMQGESQRLDNALFEIINPYYMASCGSGGYAKAEACNPGSSSWLVEVAPWDQVPATLQAFNDRYWHNLWPIYYSGALISRDLSHSLPSESEPIIPSEKPSGDLPTGDLDGLDRPEASFAFPAESLTSGSDRDILILNAILPLAEVAPWVGLILFVGFLGIVIVIFSTVGGGR